jgi:hypothetical protein
MGIGNRIQEKSDLQQPAASTKIIKFQLTEPKYSLDDLILPVST